MNSTGPVTTGPVPGTGLDAERLAPALILPLLIVGAIALGRAIVPTQGLVILGGAAAVAYLAWLLTGFRHPIESRGVVHLYLVAVTVQVVHLGEEYLYGFAPRFSSLFDTSIVWSERSFVGIFVFGFVPLWILAALAVLYRVPVLQGFGNYFVWFYALGAGLINAVAHFVFPLLAGGYFPGLYTAFVHLILSVALIAVLVRETRALRVRDRRPR